jgi:hypothetical protein
MTKQDRHKLSILIILLAVLGLTILLGYRMNQPPTAAAVQAQEQKISVNPPAPSDARIRLDLVESPEAAADDIGKRNVFQYGQAPPLLPPPTKGGAPIVALAPPQVSLPQVAPHPPGPPPAPPPPPIPLKYMGYAMMKAQDGSTAFLVDDTRPNDIKHFNVSAGEVLMGRYRVVSISEKSIDVEDLEYNRRQTLPLLK